jgi:hypothetical protein
MTSEVPYWNWYRFPTDFTAYALFFKLTAWALAGVILALLVKSPNSPRQSPVPNP